MRKLTSDPRNIRLAVYAVALAVALVGILSGVWDYDTVTQWFGDDGLVAWITLGLVSILAGSNINPKTEKSDSVAETHRTVDELADLRNRMAS